MAEISAVVPRPVYAVVTRPGSLYLDTEEKPFTLSVTDRKDMKLMRFATLTFWRKLPWQLTDMAVDNPDDPLEDSASFIEPETGEIIRIGALGRYESLKDARAAVRDAFGVGGEYLNPLSERDAAGNEAVVVLPPPMEAAKLSDMVEGEGYRIFCDQVCRQFVTEDVLEDLWDSGEISRALGLKKYGMSEALHDLGDQLEETLRLKSVSTEYADPVGDILEYVDDIDYQQQCERLSHGPI